MTKVKNQGRPKLSNIQKIQAQFWYYEALRLSKAKNTNDLAKKLALSRPDTLYKAKKGKGAPDLTTQKLATLKYPELENYYNNGPFNIIRIMKSERLRDACDEIQNQLTKLLLEHDICISETIFVYEGGPLYKWLTDMGLILHQQKYNYIESQNINSLIFAISYCEYKFLDSKKSLSRLIPIFLEYFENEFRISKELWLSDPDIAHAINYAEQFNKISEYMNRKKLQ